MTEPRFQHECPYVGVALNESDYLIVNCRCFDSEEFFALQDAMAVIADRSRVGGQ